MDKLTSDLCEMTGDEAAVSIIEKLQFPEFAMQVGKFPVHRLLAVEHRDKDGNLVVDFVSTEERRVMFRFRPSDERFADTAVKLPEEEPICDDC